MSDRSPDFPTEYAAGATNSGGFFYHHSNVMPRVHALTTEPIPRAIAETILGWGLTPWTLLIVVNNLVLIAGNFIEYSAILLIMAPILFLIAIPLDIDPFHLGINMEIDMEIGRVTLPVGLNLFVTSGITRLELTEVVKAAFPWLIRLFGFLIIITYAPPVSTFPPTPLVEPETGHP